MLSPPLILADEPTGNLDAESSTQVVDLLLDMTRTRNSTLIVATHSTELAARMQRRVELRDGGLHRDSGGASAGMRRNEAGS